MHSAKKITLPSLLATVAATWLITTYGAASLVAPVSAQAATPKTAAAKTTAQDKAEKKEAEKKEAAKTPEVVIENVVPVTADDLVKRPHEFINKNVKFTVNFFAFSNLALDYKPAMKPSKTYLSLLVVEPNSHIPLSELKLAMLIPKEKDPQTDLLAKLKDGDQIEIVGKEFSAALDDPWVEILRLKKIGGSKDDDKDKKVASESEKPKTEVKADEKSVQPAGGSK